MERLEAMINWHQFPVESPPEFEQVLVRYRNGTYCLAELQKSNVLRDANTGEALPWGQITHWARINSPDEGKYAEV